jgi:ATP-dependent Clp protease adaptor protein ClpS
LRPPFLKPFYHSRQNIPCFVYDQKKRMARTTAAPETTAKPGDELTPLFHVVLLNDDDHTYDYVIEMLTTIFSISAGAAFQHAVEVDTAGRTIVMTCEKPQAEFGRDQIHAYGADPRMERSKGSMSAIVEPAGHSR